MYNVLAPVMCTVYFMQCQLFLYQIFHRANPFPALYHVATKVSLSCSLKIIPNALLDMLFDVFVLPISVFNNQFLLPPVTGLSTFMLLLLLFDLQ